MERSRGHTLTELMVVLLIAGLLAWMATPGFSALREAWALRRASGELLAGLARARLESLSRGEAFELCPADARLRCGARPAVAWTVRAGSSSAGAAPVAVGRLPQGLTLLANRPAVTYYPWPRAASTVTLTLCGQLAGERSRRIVVSQAGRPRVEETRGC